MEEKYCIICGKKMGEGDANPLSETSFIIVLAQTVAAVTKTNFSENYEQQHVAILPKICNACREEKKSYWINDPSYNSGERVLILTQVPNNDNIVPMTQEELMTQEEDDQKRKKRRTTRSEMEERHALEVTRDAFLEMIRVFDRQLTAMGKYVCESCKQGVFKDTEIGHKIGCKKTLATRSQTDDVLGDDLSRVPTQTTKGKNVVVDDSHVGPRNNCPQTQTDDVVGDYLSIVPTQKTKGKNDAVVVDHSHGPRNNRPQHQTAALKPKEVLKPKEELKPKGVQPWPKLVCQKCSQEFGCKNCSEKRGPVCICCGRSELCDDCVLKQHVLDGIVTLVGKYICDECNKLINETNEIGHKKGCTRHVENALRQTIANAETQKAETKNIDVHDAKIPTTKKGKKIVEDDSYGPRHNPWVNPKNFCRKCGKKRGCVDCPEKYGETCNVCSERSGLCRECESKAKGEL